MKMNFIKITLVILFLASLQLFIGCKKSKPNPFSSDYSDMIRENALIEAAFDDILKVSENIMLNNNDARIATTAAPLGCITAIDSVVTGVNRKRYTATFNDSCTSYDGVTRKGTIIFDLIGTNFNTVGSELIVTFQNYSFDSNRVYGKMVVNKLSASVFKVQVSDANASGEYASLSIFNPADSTRLITQWKSVYQREIVSGSSTPTILIDNIYNITTPNSTYSMDGITSDNKIYTATISRALVIDYSCRAVGMLRYPVTGQVDFIQEYNNKRSLDYGDSAVCDKTVIILYDGSSEDFDIY
jgi:hypothetical protein